MDSACPPERRSALLIVQGVVMSELVAAADIVLPGAAWVEKDAIYTNDQGKVQGASRAIAPPGEAKEDWQILATLGRLLGLSLPYQTASDVRSAIAAALPAAYADADKVPFTRPVPARNWLQASNPSERWKWDFLYQDLPPVKGHNVQMEGAPAYIPLKAGGIAVRALIATVALLLVSSQIAVAQLRGIKAELTPLVESDAAPGSPVRAALQVRIPERFHVQSDAPRDPTLIPTVLTVDAPEGVTVGEIVFPTCDRVQSDRPVPTAAGVRARVHDRRSVRCLRDRADRATGVPARLRYQACDDRLCYAPVTADVLWTLTVARRGAERPTNHADVFNAIAFGTGRAPGIAPCDARSSDRTAAMARTIALLDEFSVAASTGGYQGTDEFLQFIRNAETGVKEPGLFEGRGPLAILFLVLLGGLALNLTPCVLPMIPINLAIIGAGAGSRIALAWLPARRCVRRRDGAGLWRSRVDRDPDRRHVRHDQLIALVQPRHRCDFCRPCPRDVRCVPDRPLAILRVDRDQRLEAREFRRGVRDGRRRRAARRSVCRASRHSGRAVLQRHVCAGDSRGAGPPFRARSSGWRCHGRWPARGSRRCRNRVRGWFA